MKNYITKKTSLYTLLLLVLSVFGCTDKNIIDAPHFPPPSVEGFEAVAGNGEVTLNWLKGNTTLFTHYLLSYEPSDGEPITIENTQNTYTISGLMNDVAYTFSLVAASTIQATTQSSEPVTAVATPFEPVTVGPEITSFTFVAASNPDMALDPTDRVDLTGAIDLDNNTISFSAEDVSAYIYTDQLIATFETEAGATVTANGETQTSGVSVQDFSSPLQYEVTKDGVSRIFTVTINKNYFATIPDMAFRDFLIAEGLPFNEQNQLETNAQAVIDYKSGAKINIDNVGISNVKGIEFFVNVNEIDAERNSFSTINISRNTVAKNLLVGLNANIDEIIIGDKTNLEILYINFAPFLTETVVQPILDANPNLRRLYAPGMGTGLTSINVDNLVKMERLRLNESTARASAASINTLLAKNPPVASDLGNLRIYNDADGAQCTWDMTLSPFTFACQ